MIAMGSGDVATILHASALEAWDALGDEWISATTLAEAIAARHLVSADDVASDLTPFIDELLERGLLESRAASVVAERRATDR